MVMTLILLFVVETRAVDPVKGSDCDVCKFIVRHIDNTKTIKELACRVLQATDVVDVEWKLHSAAFLSNYADLDVPREIAALRETGANPKMICGVMGVQSSSGGCACPITEKLGMYQDLERAIRGVKDKATVRQFDHSRIHTRL